MRVSSLYDGYNPYTAAKLLGPADYFSPNQPQNGIHRLINIIILIWKSIARIFNVIFGDHRWYDNNVACQLYINATLANNSAPAIWIALDRLRLKLQQRAHEPDSHSSGVRSLADFVDEEINQRLFSLEASQARLTPPPKRNILAEKVSVDHSFLAKDLLTSEEIDLRQMSVEQCNSLLQQFYAPSPIKLRIAEATSPEKANEMMAVLRGRGILCSLAPAQIPDNWSILIDSLQFGVAEDALTSGDRFKSDETEIRLLFDIYKDPPSQASSPSSSSQSSDLSEEDFNNRFTSAMGDVSDPDLLLPRAVYLISQMGPDLYSNEDGGEEVVAFALFKLLETSKLERGGCMRYHLNIQGQHVTDAVAKVYMEPNSSGPIPHLFYVKDLFSSTKTPAFPMSVKMMMNEFINCRSQPLDYFSESFQGSLLAAHIRNISAICCANISYTQLLQIGEVSTASSPMTARAFIEAKLTEVTQSLASEGVILQSDINGEFVEIQPHASRLICTMAAFDLIRHAARSIPFECGTFSYHSAIDEGSVVFRPVLYDIPNLLGNTGASTDVPSDPIAAKWLTSRLNSEELDFARSLCVAPLLKAVYDAKSTPNVEINQFVAEGKRRLMELYRDNPSAADAILQLGDRICQIAACLQRSFDSCVLQLVDIVDREGKVLKAGSVKFLPEASSSSSSTKSIISLVPVGEKIMREVKWEFLPGINQSHIKEAVTSTVVPSDQPMPKVSLPAGSKISKYNANTRIQLQNHVLKNYAEQHHCLYGAVAYHVFKPGLSSSEMVTILRNAVAHYIHVHRDKYREVFAADGITVEQYCMMIPINQWANHIEISALSEIFGMPIHVFDISKQSEGLKVGVKGSPDKGILLPNHIVGDCFGKLPVRLRYSGDHYEALVYTP